MFTQTSLSSPPPPRPRPRRFALLAKFATAVVCTGIAVGAGAPPASAASPYYTADTCDVIWSKANTAKCQITFTKSTTVPVEWLHPVAGSQVTVEASGGQGGGSNASGGMPSDVFATFDADSRVLRIVVGGSGAAASGDTGGAGGAGGGPIDANGQASGSGGRGGDGLRGGGGGGGGGGATGVYTQIGSVRLPQSKASLYLLAAGGGGASRQGNGGNVDGQAADGACAGGDGRLGGMPMASQEGSIMIAPYKTPLSLLFNCVGADPGTTLSGGAGGDGPSNDPVPGVGHMGALLSCSTSVSGGGGGGGGVTGGAGGGFGDLGERWRATVLTGCPTFLPAGGGGAGQNFGGSAKKWSLPPSSVRITWMLGLAPTTTLAVSQTELAVGQPLTMTATTANNSGVGIASGTDHVQFMLDGAAYGSSVDSVDDKPVSTVVPGAALTAGSHTVSAVYTGSWGRSTSAPVTVTVTPGAVSIAPASAPSQLLEVNGGRTDDGAVVDTWTKYTTSSGATFANELWGLRPAGDSGYMQIVNKLSGKCLEVNASNRKVDQWTCVPGAENELWRQVGKALQVKSNGTYLGAWAKSEPWIATDGTEIVVQDSVTDSNEWVITPQG